MPRLPPAASLLALALPVALAANATEPPPTLTTQQVLDASQPSDWRRPAPENTLYLDLAQGGRVIIELAPDFAPAHVDNIRALARNDFWAGTSIYRSHDNFVVQFGAGSGDEAEQQRMEAQLGGDVRRQLPAEFERDAEGLPFHRLPDRDGWARETGFANGFPAARDGAAGKAWMAHCYGVVGAGRGNEPNSSIGAELYVVIGQSPRQLDRNITVVGQVVKGMELLSAVPRGDGPLGVYEDAARNVPIASIRLAADLPEAQREPVEVLRTDTPTFDAFVESRRNRRDGWYLHPAGHIDLCNIAVPVRTPADVD